MAVDQRLMGKIAGQGGFADSVWADQQGVCRVLKELEGHQRLEGRPVDRGGPVPLEVAQGFEAPDTGALDAPLKAAAGAFASSQPMSAAAQPPATASGQWSSSPCMFRALARACNASGFFMTHLPQLIVGVEGMRPHDLVARADMLGQDKGDRRGLPAVVTLSL